MKIQKYFNIAVVGIAFFLEVIHAFPAGYSQTESYLAALAPTRAQAYEKIKKVLTAPDPNNSSQIITINPKQFENLINQAIEVEKQHPDYYALYHSSQKEGMLLTLLRTYLTQQEKGWTRDDFFILRRPEFFYEKKAHNALDYIKQNIPRIIQQYHAGQSAYMIANPCVDWRLERCLQFDLSTPYRNHLLSTSPAFIAGVDDTDNDMRQISELDYTAWESSFYYFATNLSWSNVRRLYLFLVADLKKYYPQLFKNTAMNNAVRKYVAIKFSKIIELLFPHVRQKLGPSEQTHAKAGMMFQFLIPKNIIDKVAYLAWANGILWQRSINGIKDGWDNDIGAYTKLSSILEIMQSNPEQLGRSLHLLQARLILKDKDYFYNPSSPIKIRLIHSLPPSLFRVIEDSLKSIARVVVENNQAQQKRKQTIWVGQTNIEYEVKKYEENLKKLLASNQLKDQIEGMNLLYYFVQIGTSLPLGLKEALKHQNSAEIELKTISQEILAAIAATQSR